MPRVRNTQSGAVGSVSEEKAARLGSEWELVEKPATKSTAKKSSSSKSEK